MQPVLLNSALVAFAVAAGPALGQVTRCVDPETQKVTYTDGLCATGEKSTLISRKMTFAETLQQERDAAAARARIEREADALRGRQSTQDRIPSAPSAVGLNGVSGAGPSGSTGRAECERARRDLETRQSSISRKKNDNDISGLIGAGVGCGIDASKYIVDPPARIQLDRPTPGQYDIRIDSRRR